MAHKEGWAKPGANNKFHFFRDGRSLCCKWLFLGPLEDESETPVEQTPDDCKACYKALMTPKKA